MTDENEQPNSTKEKLEGVGQTIIGELEIIGGILTADPITQAEGEFNVEVGELHRETSESLDESEPD
jgi:hypothetical protein